MNPEMRARSHAQQPHCIEVVSSDIRSVRSLRTTGVWFFAKKKSESSVLLQPFRHFSHNENPMRALYTISLKCCLPSTDAIHRREKIGSIRIKVQGCASFKSIRFSRKKEKARYFYKCVYICANICFFFIIIS